VMSWRRVRMAPAMCDTGGGVCDTGVCVSLACVLPVVCMLCVCCQWSVCHTYVVSVVVVGPDLHPFL
jgi:hypothetical protein